MTTILYANNAAGTLAAGITNVATTLTLNAGQAALFPAPVPPQVFYVTLTDAATQTAIEIVKVTAVSGNVFSITRAQDGTLAQSWLASDIVSQRAIALEMRGWENAAEGLFNTQNVAITPSTTLGIVGTTAGDNANAGSVGEFLNLANTGINLVSGNTFTGASVVLTAGDWDVQGVAQFRPSGTTSLTTSVASISFSGTTLSPNFFNSAEYAYTDPIGNNVLFPTPVVRVNVAITTTIFCVVNAVFSGGSCLADGFIRARRVR